MKLLSYAFLFAITAGLCCLIVVVSLSQNRSSRGLPPSPNTDAPEITDGPIISPQIARVFGITKGKDVIFFHSVNSHSALQAVFDELLVDKYKTVSMIEADIVTINGAVMMGHRPTDRSDLAFDEFIRRFEEFVHLEPIHVGLKLDLKDAGVVEPVVRRLAGSSLVDNSTRGYPVPLWLNADIIQGPGGTPPRHDPTVFANIVQAFLPDAVLSLGWTTLADRGRYEPSHVEAMISAVKALPKGIKEITFPVRATLLQNSWPHLMRLLQTARATGRAATFTVWGRVTPALLRWIEEHAPEDTFFDLQHVGRGE